VSKSDRAGGPGSKERACHSIGGSGPIWRSPCTRSPGGRRTQTHGIHGGAIKIRVAARAADGAANEAMLEFLAEALQVPRRRCVLISGATSRNKRVRIESPDRARAELTLAQWLQTSS